MKFLKVNILFIIAIAVMIVSCADLSVDNLNNPDAERALASTADLETLASGLFNNWYNDTYGYEQDGTAGQGTPAEVFAVAADNVSCSWGNMGMNDSGKEPRLPFDNTTSYPYEFVSSAFFDNMYATLSSASDILSAINAGVDFGANENRIIAWSKFNQALVLSNIALTFDQGYIVDENTSSEELLSPELIPSSDIAAHAQDLFDEVIALSNANTFTLPDGYINGVTVDDVLLGQLANTYAARLLAYMPRTAAENSSVDWTAVRDYALEGLTSDFEVLMDDVNWLNDHRWVTAYPGWGRMDMRVINLMDDSYPAHNAAGDDFPAPDSATVIDDPDIDDRLFTDFQHLPSNNFNADRGLYYFSSFRISRYDDYLSTWTVPVPEILKAENDMLLAEAYLELNDPVNASLILNDAGNSRKARGGLPDVLATEAEVSAAIHHERQVELATTSFGVAYFDMRKRDLLQEGTFLQLPLPAKTLELLEMPQPFYTFGGNNPSSSTGGWR